METLIPINIIIADRSYRIRISPSDEETVRGTVKVINDKLLEFKTQFAGKDMQDYVSMVILWYATQQKAVEKRPPSDENMQEKVNFLEQLLDKALRP
ncbi:MAG TPA: cell division protein ZapA [Flavitalea sp.]|nr:cell division protein ZapA [Flavitalea sp.]